MQIGMQQRQRIKGLKHTKSLQQPSNQDHFSYFQNLEQKLIKESHKLTSLIEKPKNIYKKFSLGQEKHARKWTINTQSALLPDNNDTKSVYSPNKKTTSMVQSTLTVAQLLQTVKNHTKKAQSIINQKRVRLETPSTPTIHTHKRDFSECESISNGVNFQSKGKNIEKLTNVSSSSSLCVLVQQEPVSLFKTSQKKKLSLDDFQIIKYLQEGQFGSVYLARQIFTQFICALKKIPKKLFDGEMSCYIDQLVRQIKINSYLDHPNIAQLYNFFEDSENIYLVLEFCCGGNLYNYMKKSGRLPEDQVRSFMRQICHAIEFMHDSDIIHRDIKPENVLIHQNIVKICDFGWSICSPLMRGTRCGTPLYSSPEMVQKQTYDNKIDVWNIGILTFELLFGRVPFEIRTEQDLSRVVDEQIYFPKNVPASESAKDFILSCLNKDPKKRIVMSRLIDHQFISE